MCASHLMCVFEFAGAACICLYFQNTCISGVMVCVRCCRNLCFRLLLDVLRLLCACMALKRQLCAE